METYTYHRSVPKFRDTMVVEQKMKNKRSSKPKKAKRHCKSMSQKNYEKIEQLQSTVRSQQKEIKGYKTANRQLERKYERVFKHVMKSKPVRNYRSHSKSSKLLSCGIPKSPLFHGKEVLKERRYPFGCQNSDANKSVSSNGCKACMKPTKETEPGNYIHKCQRPPKAKKRKDSKVDAKISSLKSCIQKAMTEFKGAERDEKKHLSKRVKRIEQVFEQRYKDLRKAIDKEKKAAIKREKEITKLRLERKVERLCKILQMEDASHPEDTLPDEVELDTNLRDSMVHQSANGSVLTDIKPNISQIEDTKNLSVIARKSSTGKDSEIRIEQLNGTRNFPMENKENIAYNPQVSGFMTLNASSKYPRMINEVPPSSLIPQCSVSGSIQNNLGGSNNGQSYVQKNYSTAPQASGLLNQGLKQSNAYSYEFDISSSDDSEDDLARFAAVSPRIRNKIDTQELLKPTGVNFIALCANSTTPQENTFGMKKTSKNTNFGELESRDTKHMDTSDSENSDEEISNIEKRIQRSLEQVTNRLKKCY
ncbi:unnamed protein product [Moneuplotes crassus]|uniref:Uncharacterized protein n=1 Tax=Euplotes crassus TaxID=5936 RepID=A0AAD1U8Z7_EUPCR|nr:unnamed protein product [Moneuplotes crassus]